MTHTRTYAILDVSVAAYEEVKARLLAANHGQRIVSKQDGEIIDVADIALRREQDEDAVKVYLVYQGKVLPRPVETVEEHSVESVVECLRHQTEYIEALRNISKEDWKVIAEVSAVIFGGKFAERPPAKSSTSVAAAATVCTTCGCPKGPGTTPKAGCTCGCH